MNAKELISKYGIQLWKDGKIRISNVNAVKRDNAFDEIKSRKQEIIDFLNAEKEAERQAALDRKNRIAAIPGLMEIKEAMRDIEDWHDDFNRSFEGKNACGGVNRPMSKFNIAEMKLKYPVAASYLKAERYYHSDNYRFSSAGKKALDKIIYNPDNHEEIIREMEKEIDESLNLYD